ncbi:MAG: cytochrome c biogenesis protein ResB [Planctomycetota bacterium]
MRSASGRLGPRVTVVLVLALGAVTLLGTLAAARDGVMAAQAAYFDAFLTWVDLPLGLALPLPGARLLLWLLLATLLLDRSAWVPGTGRASVVFVHVGVAALLAGAVLAPRTRVEGHLWLEPGEAVSTVHRGEGDTIRLPFALRLRACTRRFHPGTDVLAGIEAGVDVLVEGQAPLATVISSNRPLRRSGFAVYLPATPAAAPTDLGALHLVAARSQGHALTVAVSALLAGALVWHFGRALCRHVRAGAPPAPP